MLLYRYESKKIFSKKSFQKEGFSTAENKDKAKNGSFEIEA